MKCAPTDLLTRSVTANSSLVLWDRPAVGCDSDVKKYHISVDPGVKREELYVEGTRQYIDLLGLKPSTKYTVTTRTEFGNASESFGFAVSLVTKASE